MALWKSVENFSGFGMDRAEGKEPFGAVFCGETGASVQCLRACSACAGDYEDPDRTAWDQYEEEDFAIERGREKVQGEVENGTELDEMKVENTHGKGINDEFPGGKA
jgi:hypothetical protein